MILTLKVINSDATLNNFFDIGSVQIVKGSDATILLQLNQTDRKLRYIPNAGAVITIDLLKSDNTVLTKTATQPFADDRSVIQFVLTDTETLNLISQNLKVKVNEGGDIIFALLQSAFQMVSPTQTC